MKVSQAVNYCLEYHGAHSKKKYEPRHGIRPSSKKFWPCACYSIIVGPIQNPKPCATKPCKTCRTEMRPRMQSINALDG